VATVDDQNLTIEQRRALALARARARAAQQQPVPPVVGPLGQPMTDAPVQTPPPGGLRGLGQAAQTGLTRGAIGTAGMLGATANLVGHNVPGMGFLQNDLGFEGQERRMAQLVGPQTQPQGRLEETIALGSEFVGPGLLAGAVRRGTIGGASLLGSMGRETLAEVPGAVGAVAGQQALYGGEHQGIGELAGGLLGGASASMRRMSEPSADEAIRMRTRDIGPERFAEARQLARQGEEIGFPLTPDEALRSPQLQAVSGGLMRQPQGADLVALREGRVDQPSRSGTFRSVVERTSEELLGPLQDQPMRQGVQAATRAAQQAKLERTAAVRPYYQRASQPTPDNDVPRVEVENLVASLEQLRDRTAQGLPARGHIDNMLNMLRREDGSLQTNAGQLDQVYQHFRDLASVPATSPLAQSAQGVGAINSPVQMLRAITETNPNIAQGRRIYEQITYDEVAPLLQGPIGAVARGDGREIRSLDNLMRRFFEGTDFDAQDFDRAVRQMSRVEGGRDALQAMTHHYIRETANKAMIGTASGPRANPSAQFAALLDRNTPQRRNLNSLFDALDRADQSAGMPRANRRLAFNNMMEVMEATRAPTQARGAGLTEGELIGGSNTVVRRVLATFRPLMTPAAAISQTVSESVGRQRAINNWNRIAEAMTATGPEGVDAIQRMATAGRRGPAAARAAAELLAVRGRLFYDPETGEEFELPPLEAMQ
jgi:hypothetical protein